MADLRELYQEVILDHSKEPRNFHLLDNANFSAEGFNPLCGDHLYIYLHTENDVIVDVAFQGSGCAISTASASLMTEAIKGKTKAEAEKLFSRFHHLVTHETAEDDLGKLNILVGVKQFPMRVKCATLAWHTLHAALHQEAEPVSTE